MHLPVECKAEGNNENCIFITLNAHLLMQFFMMYINLITKIHVAFIIIIFFLPVF